MASQKTETRLRVKAPNFQTIKLKIEGTAPLVQRKFSEKSKDEMKKKQMQGKTSRSKKKVHDARDFERDFKEAQHISTDGWNGIPAPAFRSASIRACKLVGYHMTDARMSIFVIAEGYGEDGTPLVRILGDPPKQHEAHVRIPGTTDIRSRPMFVNWGCHLKVTFDGDQFTAEDVVNVFKRAGIQVGVGEGRPFSKSSDGMGWGTFDVTGIIND